MHKLNKPYREREREMRKEKEPVAVSQGIGSCHIPPVLPTQMHTPAILRARFPLTLTQQVVANYAYVYTCMYTDMYIYICICSMYYVYLFLVCMPYLI